jgi:carboxylesterase type B
MTPLSETNHSKNANKSDNSPLITIPGVGTVKGILDNNGKVAKFLNVPFGLVEERWRPAVKAKSWEGIRDATKPG